MVLQWNDSVQAGTSVWEENKSANSHLDTTSQSLSLLAESTSKVPRLPQREPQTEWMAQQKCTFLTSDGG
jgi:hypothetical protein